MVKQLQIRTQTQIQIQIQIQTQLQIQTQTQIQTQLQIQYKTTTCKRYRYRKFVMSRRNPDPIKDITTRLYRSWYYWFWDSCSIGEVEGWPF